MKKILLAASFSLLLSNFSHAQLFKPKADKKQKFATPVAMSAAKPSTKKAEAWFYYSIADNKAEEHNLKIADMRYNLAGELIEWKVFDMSGEIDYIYLYEYQTNPKRIKRFIQYPETEPILDLLETYNDKNQLVKSEYFGADNKLIETNEWEYNAQGNVTLSTKRNDKNVLIYKVRYEYDEKGRARKETHFNLQTDETHDITFSYNQNNLLAQETRYQSTGELDRKILYSYDDKERVLEKKSFRGKELEVVEKYIYSSISNEVAHSTYTAGGNELSEYVVYKYEFN